MALCIEASASPEAKGLALRFELRGDLAQVRLPTAQSPGPAEGLWQHSCFEAFVAPATGEAYQEFNFSPSGQWAHYRFQRERLRERTSAMSAAPHCRWTTQGRSLRLDVQVAGSDLPATSASLLMGLSAVIETQDGALSYWALHHPAAHPDFHHRGGWTMRLNPAAPLPATHPLSHP